MSVDEKRLDAQKILQIICGTALVYILLSTTAWSSMFILSSLLLLASIIVFTMLNILPYMRKAMAFALHFLAYPAYVIVIGSLPKELEVPNVVGLAKNVAQNAYAGLLLIIISMLALIFAFIDRKITLNSLINALKFYVFVWISVLFHEFGHIITSARPPTALVVAYPIGAATIFVLESPIEIFLALAGGPIFTLLLLIIACFLREDKLVIINAHLFFINASLPSLLIPGTDGFQMMLLTSQLGALPLMALIMMNTSFGLVMIRILFKTSSKKKTVIK